MCAKNVVRVNVSSSTLRSESVWYSEFHPPAAAWLRELAERGLIPLGVVDDRDMREVSPADLQGITQAHWFAGIGGWAHALRLAEWPGNRPVWTASLPCQPFSLAGSRDAFEDDRHLWPHFLPLVARCLPSTIVGEQVAGTIGKQWFEGVSFDLRHIVYWRSLEKVIAEIRAADSTEHIAEIVSSAIGKVELVLSEKPSCFTDTMKLLEPDRCATSPLLESWEHPKQRQWTLKTVSDTASYVGLDTEAFQSDFMLATLGDNGVIGGDGIRRDCYRVLGEKEVTNERSFSETFRTIIARSSRRLRLTGIPNDVEAAGYEVAATDLPACSVQAPHWRSRLYWAAYIRDASKPIQCAHTENAQTSYLNTAKLADTDLQHETTTKQQARQKNVERHREASDRSGERLANTNSLGCEAAASNTNSETGRTSSFSFQWAHAKPHIWADGKSRRIVRRFCWMANGISPELDISGNSSADENEEIVELTNFLSATFAAPTWVDDFEVLEESHQLLQELQQTETGFNTPSEAAQTWLKFPEETRLNLASMLHSKGARLLPLSPMAKKDVYRKQLLKGYGNAIVPQVAAMFLVAVMRAIDNAEKEMPSDSTATY